MAITPVYAKFLQQAGCCNEPVGGNGKFKELEKKLTKQAVKIDQLIANSEGNLPKASMVLVRSLGNVPLFNAHSTEEKQNDE